MARKARAKPSDDVKEKIELDQDFTVVALPRPFHGISLYLAFSPGLPNARIPQLLSVHKTFYPLAYVKGGGASIHHLTNVEGYQFSSLIILSPHIFVIVYYDRPDFGGYRYVAQSVMGIDNAGYYSPGFGPQGEVDRIRRQVGIRQEVADVKGAIKEQIDQGDAR